MYIIENSLEMNAITNNPPNNTNSTSNPLTISFNPQEFFTFAGSIIQDPNANEASLRSAISRAYYSMFLIARDIFFGTDQARLSSPVRKQIDRSYQLRYSRPNNFKLHDHERVIFIIEDKAKNIVLSQQLDQLREARINADYKMDQACLANVGKQSWRDYATETMQLATQILPSLKTLPPY